MRRVHWLLIEGINPEPWTAPTTSTGRRGGKVFATTHKNAQLRSYQSALRETLGKLDRTPYYDSEDLELDVWFWRRLERYRTDSGRWHTKHRADRSNMLKALEDALQRPSKRELDAGLTWSGLFRNDAQIVAGRTLVVEQGVDVEPMILMRICPVGAVTRFDNYTGRNKVRHLRSKMKDGAAIWEEP